MIYNIQVHECTFVIPFSVESPIVVDFHVFPDNPDSGEIIVLSNALHNSAAFAYVKIFKFPQFGFKQFAAQLRRCAGCIVRSHAIRTARS